MKILVVEDVAYSSVLVTRFLESQGHSVLNAKDGFEALRILEDEDGIGCVVCDLFLQDMTGFQIFQECQRIKKYNKYNVVETPPFILLTSSTNPAHFQQAMAMGFTAALTKPLKPKELQEALLETGKMVSETEHVDSKLKILVVDVNGDIYNTLKEVYVDSDYRIVWVTAGYRCLEYLEQGQEFKMIVCSADLPDLTTEDFLTMTSHMQENNAEIKIPPSVLMTTPDKIMRMDGEISKKLAAVIPYPMNHFELKQKLSRVLSESKIEKPLQDSILIVDDLSFNISVIKALLARFPRLHQMNCKLLSAASGKEALDILKADYSIFLVIADMQMPFLNGIELLQHYNNYISQDEYLRSDAFPKPHFFMFTAEKSMSLTQEAMAAGYEHVFNKPVVREELLQAVEGIFSSSPASSGMGDLNDLVIEDPNKAGV